MSITKAGLWWSDLFRHLTGRLLIPKPVLFLVAASTFSMRQHGFPLSAQASANSPKT